MNEHKTIYTLGTSNRTKEEFFKLLNTYQISTIVDVRRFPKSKRFPHFNREHLEEEALKHGKTYLWLGDLLGGFRSGGYESYKREEAYLEGIKKVEALAVKSSPAIICAERLPWKCHRFHISKSLLERGWDVIHIIDQDHTWSPKNAGVPMENLKLFSRFH